MIPSELLARLGPLLLVTVAAVPPLFSQDEAPSLAEALSEGEFSVDFRYRFESVSDDSSSDDGEASTLRTALGYRTKPYAGFSLYLEAVNVSDLGLEDRHNNAGRDGLGNGITDRPVIADPEITEINQAYVRIARGETQIDLGRQEINLGDQRFVGAVGWRQNHQSFDAVSLANESLENVRFFYAFLENTNRIFGDNKQMRSHLGNVVLDLPVGTLTLYGYLLDYRHAADFGLSRATYGAELAGSREVGENRVLYEVEYADQSDFADNPANVSAGYVHAMAGGEVSGLTIKLGYELLEGSPAAGSFATPLATLHKFNGWADKFLATPGNGLEDLYLHLGGRIGKVSLLGVYHDFSSDSGGVDYGAEIDLQATVHTPWKQLFGLKAALYDADTFSTDTDKIWFWTAYRF